MFEPDLESQPKCAIFNLDGKLSLEETAHLRKAFWEVIHNQTSGRLILNFEKVPKLNPSVISLLVATKNVVARAHGQLILVGLKPNHMQFLERTHLHQYFEIRPDLDSCLEETTAGN